jgi:hypothetical protein
MDAITALASWPKSIDEIAHAVADPDSPPIVAEIREVARAIGDGDARLVEDGSRTNLGLRQHVILRWFRRKVTGAPVAPKKVASHGSMHSWQQWARWPPSFH